MEIVDILEILGLLITNAVSYGMLKAKVNNLHDQTNKLDNRITHVDDKVNDHSVTMAELRADVKHVMDTLNSIDDKLDKILTGGK